MMTADEVAQLVRECEDSSRLGLRLEWAKRHNVYVNQLSELRVTRGWSEQHFFAICTVVLARVMNAAPDK